MRMKRTRSGCAGRRTMAAAVEAAVRLPALGTRPKHVKRRTKRRIAMGWTVQ
jgi:hypothetical protein